MGLSELSKRQQAEEMRLEYLRRIDAEAVLEHYGADNVHQHGDEIIHSCLIDRVDPHHSHGDANPSASLNVDKKVYNCIAPGAWVMTPNGGRPIEELTVGDLVLTHRGRYRPVTRTYSRHINETVIEYRPVGSMPFLVTKEHRMLTAARNTCGRCSKPNGCRHAPVDPVGWHEAHKINRHVVARGRMTESADVDRVRLPEQRHGNDKVKVSEIDLDAGVLRLAGYYLAEGFATKNDVRFTLNPAEVEYADDIARLSEATFGVMTTRSLHRGALVVAITSRTVARFFSGQFGTGCDQKSVPRWIMDLPWERQRELLLGLYRGDGSVSAQRQSRLALANQHLVYQVWQMLSRIGARTGLSRVPGKPYSINGYEGIGRDLAVLTWADDCSENYRYINDKSRHGFRESPGSHSQYWTAGSGESCVSASWREVPYDGMVYDVEVAEDHSFVVEGVVSSNCYGYGGGDVLWFITKMERKEELYQVVPVLGQFLNDSTVDTATFLEEMEKYLRDDVSTDSLPTYNERILRRWAKYHPYLRSRGITKETAQEFQLGYDEDNARITIPHWVNGQLVGWQRRALSDPRWPQTQVERAQDGTELDGGRIPKYKNSSSFPKDSTLYRLDAVRQEKPLAVIVVESPMSVAKAHSCGITNVVATFGSKVNQPQIDLLKPFHQVVVWFDADPAGENGAYKLMEGLWHHTMVTHVIPEDGKDMADYDADGMRERLQLPYIEPAVLALARLEERYGNRRR